MQNQTRTKIINEIAETIDIPDSAYEIAEARYKDLAVWIGRPESGCSKFNPSIYPQGSFRLGTVIRPVDEDGGYDLDIGCRLRQGVTKSSHTPKQLKQLVGADLEAYRVARRVRENLEEKNRCWRLMYADNLNFHIDTVPSIPEVEEARKSILEMMTRGGVNQILAAAIASHTGAITDKRDPYYEVIHQIWRISNSEGYALWFESRMKMAQMLMENRASLSGKTKIEELPTFRWKSPLQRCIQILKRHRDFMFADSPDKKPISIIITTLASMVYQGEQDIADALDAILSGMASKINPEKPRVPNPVNPKEDFTDRWSDPRNVHLKLEENFNLWLRQAQTDFAAIANCRNADSLFEIVNEKFGVNLRREGLQNRLGFGAPAVAPIKQHIITGVPAKPWSQF